MLKQILLCAILLILPLYLTAQEPIIEDPYDEDYYAYWDEEFSLTILGAIKTSQQMETISRQDIEKYNAQDLGMLLQQALGLNLVRYGGYGSQTNLHIRGYSSRRIAFLVDGIPQNSAMDSGFDLNRIDLSSIERIEVIHGGSDSRYNVSGAMGGLINIVTMRQEEPSWSFGGTLSNRAYMPSEYIDRQGKKQGPHWEELLDGQSFSFNAAYGGDSTKPQRFSFRGGLFANRASNQFIYSDHFNIVRRKENNQVWDGGANASFIWGLGDYSSLIASSNVYYADKNIPVSGFARIYGTQEDISFRQALMLELPRAGRDDLGAEFSLAWHFARLDYTSPGGIFSRHDQNTLLAINRWAWYPQSNLTLRTGWDYGYTMMESTEVGSPRRHQGGIFLGAEWQPTGALELNTSLKGVTAGGPGEGGSQGALIPKLGLLWNMTDSFALRSNVFRSFKFPDFEELYWTGGTGAGRADLLPEEGWGADLGALVSPPGTWNLSLEGTVFAQWMRNSIHWAAGGSGAWSPQNAGEAVFFGFDSRARAAIPLQRGPFTHLSPSLSYTYLRSYLLSFGYTYDSDKRIPYNPEHTLGLGLELGWKSGNFLVATHYESLRYSDRANETELDSYLLLNVSVNQSLNSKLSIFGSMENILNRSYETFYAYPMPGFSFTLGLRFQS